MKKNKQNKKELEKTKIKKQKNNLKGDYYEWKRIKRNFKTVYYPNS